MEGVDDEPLTPPSRLIGDPDRGVPGEPGPWDVAEGVIGDLVCYPGNGKCYKSEYGVHGNFLLKRCREITRIGGAFSYAITDSCIAVLPRDSRVQRGVY